MRLKVELKSLTSGLLDYNYNHHLQSMIYEVIEKADKSYADSLHEHSNPKFFVFSQLFFEKFSTTKEGIQTYTGQLAKFFISSPRKEFIMKVIEGFLKVKKVVKIGDSYWKVDNIEILKPANIIDIFDTLSPITVSINKDGKIVDLSPQEESFYIQLKKNLLKKYRLFYGDEYRGDLVISHDFITHVKPKRIKVKNTYHIAYHIKGLRIIASSKMLKLGYDAGLGEKNSMGFGMIVERGGFNG